jgi:hypothetical protein
MHHWWTKKQIDSIQIHLPSREELLATSDDDLRICRAVVFISFDAVLASSLTAEQVTGV